MKAVKIYEPGGPEKLILEEVPTPSLQPGWSLIKIAGFGINRSEIFTRKGYSPSVSFPRILGIECVGCVESSEIFRHGQMIVSIMGEMGRAFDGSYAEYVLLPNSQIYPVATNLSLEQLVATPETYYTAYGSYKNLKVSENDTILVRGASSAAGIAFCSLVKAQYPSVRIEGSTHTLSKAQLLKSRGFDDVILDNNGILHTTHTYTKILELVGPKVIKDSLSHLEECGIICSSGQLGEQWYLDDFDPIMELKNNVYLTTFYSGNVNADKVQKMFDFIEKFDVQIHPEKVFTLDQIRQAHQYLENRKGSGKVICLVK